MKRLRKIIEALAYTLSVTGLTILLVLAGCTLIDGLLRGLINYPLDWVREVGGLVAAICGACCLPVVLLERGNITLRLFDKLGQSMFVRLLDVVVSIAVTLVMVLMAYEFYKFGIKTALAGDVTWAMNIPIAPFWFVVDGIFWISALVQTYVVVEDVVGYKAPREEIHP